MGTTIESESRSVEVVIQCESVRELPCGCTSVTTSNGSFEVRWCPHHRAIHGVVPGTHEMPTRPSPRVKR
jgi:hypothetical protein